MTGFISLGRKLIDSTTTTLKAMADGNSPDGSAADTDKVVAGIDEIAEGLRNFATAGVTLQAKGGEFAPGKIAGLSSIDTDHMGGMADLLRQATNGLAEAVKISVNNKNGPDTLNAFRAFLPVGTLPGWNSMQQVILKYRADVAGAGGVANLRDFERRYFLLAIKPDADVAAAPDMRAVAGAVGGMLLELVRDLMNKPEIIKLAGQVKAAYNRASSQRSALGYQLSELVPPSKTTMGTQGDGVEADVITYIAGKGAKGAENITEVAVGRANKVTLQALGLDRFNTAIVRNLCLITNVNRVLRSKLAHEFAEQRTILQRGADIVASGMTEYNYDETSRSKVYFSERNIASP